jgi:hypothetical protein
VKSSCLPSPGEGSESESAVNRLTSSKSILLAFSNLSTSSIDLGGGGSLFKDVSNLSSSGEVLLCAFANAGTAKIKVQSSNNLVIRMSMKLSLWGINITLMKKNIGNRARESNSHTKLCRLQPKHLTNVPWLVLCKPNYISNKIGSFRDYMY